MSPVDIKKCKMAELSMYTTEELSARLRDLRDDLLEQHVSLATNQATNFGQRELIKRAIARCLMIMRMRELGKLPTPASGTVATKPGRETKEKKAKGKG
jgi:ribosomal protein L29